MPLLRFKLVLRRTDPPEQSGGQPPPQPARSTSAHQRVQTFRGRLLRPAGAIRAALDLYRIFMLGRSDRHRIFMRRMRDGGAEHLRVGGGPNSPLAAGRAGTAERNSPEPRLAADIGRARRRLRRYRHLAALRGAPVARRFRQYERARDPRRPVADRVDAGSSRHPQIRARHHAGRQPRRRRAVGPDRAGAARGKPLAAALSVDHGGGPGRGRAVLRRRRHHPGDLGAERGRRAQGRDADVRALRRPDLARAPDRPLSGAAPRRRSGGQLFRPGDAGLVRGAGAARGLGDGAAAPRPPRPRPALGRGGAVGRAVARLFDAGRGLSRGYRGRDALRRYGAFRPPGVAPGLARPGLSGAGAELFRAGRAAARQPGRDREPVLPPGAGMGPLPAGGLGGGGDHHRLAGGDFGRLLDHPPGGAARLSAAAGSPSHLGDRDRPGLCAAHQRRAARCGRHAGARLPIVGQPRRGLRHRGQRHDGDHHRARISLHARPRLEPRRRGAGVCRSSASST